MPIDLAMFRDKIRNQVPGTTMSSYEHPQGVVVSALNMFGKRASILIRNDDPIFGDVTSYASEKLVEWYTPVMIDMLREAV